MKKGMSGWWGLLGAAALLLSSEFDARAITITFDQPGASTGMLSYNGTGGPLVGLGVNFQTVNVDIDDDGTDEFSFACQGCLLNFTTGNNLTENVVAGPPAFGNYTWDAGGSFTIVGTIFDGATQVTGSNATLLSGSFTSSPSNPSATITPTVGAAIGFGADNKDTDLLAYVGIPAGAPFTFGSTNITGIPTNLVTGGGSLGAFNATVTEADVSNFSPVPEPTSLFLLGSGLVGLGLLRRRRNGKENK